jgi:2-polyprenyl-3-methyl-5-hydroxy-6-metoxy-1,4-benzoquinol methylase
MQKQKLDYSLSTDKILEKVFAIFKSQFPVDARVDVLDIGSGKGSLIQLLRSYAQNIQPRCVDYTDELLTDVSIKVDVVDLNVDKLPYADGQFDFLTCTEVIEHLENYRQVVRESYRVLKPNGLAVYTTPNTLSLVSRVRYLWTGFQNLFGPLNVGRGEFFSTGGHITPVSYFFLAHALAEAGFEEITLSIDKRQSSAYPLMVVFFPFIALFGAMAFAREKRKGFLNESNHDLIRPINTFPMLLGRTIVVTARKNTLPT